MKQNRSIMFGVLLLCVALCLPWRTFAAGVESAYAGAWRIQVAKPATADLTLRLTLTPKKQTAIVIPVALKSGRPADGVARDIRASLNRKLGRTAYKVEVEGAEVIVAAEMGTPRFELAIDSTAAGALGVTLKRE